MSQLGSVGVGLSVAFALFMVVLIVELLHMWRSGQKRREVAVSNCATQAKQVQQSSTWRHMVAVSGSVVGLKEVKCWAKLCLQSRLWRSEQAGASVADEVRGGAQEMMTLEEGNKLQEGVEMEEDREEDVFREEDLWVPPRLLFTIKEETKEEMEQLEEEVWSCGGVGKLGRSRSCVSSELGASACSSPFVTPPSSPPFATPLGSPALLPLRRHGARAQETGSSSSSTSSSTSPPRPGRPLSALFEDSSSFSSSSSAATPATLSPSAPPSSVSPIKRLRHPLSLLLDPPPSPSSTLYLYQTRVYPVTSPTALLGNVHVDGVKPTQNLLSPFSPFHLPAPCKPTTPCPFRASKITGIAASSPTSQRADDLF